MSDEQLFPNPSGYKPGAQGKRQRKSSNPVKALLITISLSMVGGLLGKGCAGLFFLSDSSPAIRYDAPNDPWRRYSLSGAQMSLELPGAPEALTAEKPPEIRSRIVTHKEYQFERDWLFVLAMYEEYTRDVMIDVDGAAITTLENMKRAEGVSDLHYSLGQRNSSETTFSGNLTRQNTAHEINGFARSKGQRGWVVLIIGLRDSVRSKSAAKRILDSVTTD
jgi:hypothetical protein